MIQISQMKLPCGAPREQLYQKLLKELKLSDREIAKWKILRHSVDARKKPELFDVYSVGVTLHQPQMEQKKVKRLKNRNIILKEETIYHFPVNESAPAMKYRPIVIGSGPAGLFCAGELARHGYAPLILERGQSMEERIRSVERFWETGELHPQSNIQFGEGGAGTFSDGKLTAGIKDPFGRNRRVLETFIRNGAPEEIGWENLPHIGTDLLRKIIVNIRKEIEAGGGRFCFNTLVTDILEEDGQVKGVQVRRSGEDAIEEIPSDVVVLAPGHSARDTIRVLHGKKNVEMTQKAFAVGYRLSHPQSMINHQQYGVSDPETMQKLKLTPSSYKLTSQCPSGRGVYSFCMCPGGYVVNASSEHNRLAVNGMSDYLRDSARANSAIVMTVKEEDFGSSHVLAGLQFQEELEERAYAIAEGAIPVQSYLSFRDHVSGNGNPESEEGSQKVHEPVVPLTKEEGEALCIKGRAARADLTELLPRELREDFLLAMQDFGKKIKGYDGSEAYVMGLESRTSSPVRILRDESCQSTLRGLFPSGEGAGYAGGITSAAMDGIKVAEAIAGLYAPCRKD